MYRAAYFWVSLGIDVGHHYARFEKRFQNCSPFGFGGCDTGKVLPEADPINFLRLA